MSDLSYRINTALMLLVSFGGVSAVARAAAADAVAMAEQSLRRSLATLHPHVTQWTVDPLIGKRQHSSLPDAEDARASVSHVGKRSAVRLTWTQGRGAANATVWFAVSGLQSVPTSTQDVRAGAALSPEMARYTDHDVFAAACTVLSSPAELAGTRTKRRLRAGEVMCAEAIEPRPPVARGENVLVRSTAGAVTITAKAVAQQDGALGQLLRVKNPVNGEVYLAAVSGMGEVVVHE